MNRSCRERYQDDDISLNGVQDEIAKLLDRYVGQS